MLAGLALVLTMSLVPAAVPSAAAHDCKCRFAGRDWSLGQRACFGPDGASRLMECRMNQNITAWVEVADGCPAAALGPPQGSVRGTLHGDGSSGPAVRATLSAAFRASAAAQP
ncbi:hypothetical protein [Methylobrevis albus]|uniref:Integral membrane protein n=1 Tax=Methylobrevis albus TaxID=2793297 RepID=A0A931I1N8_9HYPH|nr:hypothetical protein [Methylobrevis albus]MBH0237665.1 hypothetical protein [Methylobrevis albus]